MSKSNSHGNNHLPSEIRQASLGPPSTLLYSASYPFELTEEFQVAFADNDGVPLPSSYRRDIWQLRVGDAAWAKECADTDAANKAILAEYEQQVAAVTLENQRRNDSNCIVMQEYSEQLSAYHRELADFPRHQEEMKVIQEEKAIALRLEELHQAIRSQDDFVAAAIEDAWQIAVEEWRQVPLLKKLVTFSKRRERLAAILTYYSFLRRRDKRLAPKYKFFLSSIALNDEEEKKFFSPTDVEHTSTLLQESLRFAELTPNKSHWLLSRYFREEPRPFGEFSAKDFSSKVPLSQAFHQRVTVSQVQRHRKEVLSQLLLEKVTNSMKRARSQLVEQYKDHLLDLVPQPPCKPQEPILQEAIHPPAQPNLLIPQRPQPPADCFDISEMNDIQHVFKGSQVYAIDQVAPLARASLFAEDRVRPYFSFGGLPFAITGNASHTLIVGTTGSGKTTAFLRLMSSLLPLSTAQARRIAQRIASGEARYPMTNHEWGRSRTHQAVVYNAKGEYLRYLEAFGFDSNVDLFNLDPTDPNGYAWDVAADINDRESIEKFAEQLVPMNTAASRDRNVEFWLGAARRVIEALIIAFRNAARAAGKEPAWTLRDLVTVASTDDSIKHLLRWHDTPVQKEKELFSLSNAQSSSIMLTLRESLGHFALLANRWHDAKKRGRTISLKAWSLNGVNSVLVLPNTKANVSAYAPLNMSVIKALAGLWLNEEYSLYIDDNGEKQKLHRHIFIDELGQAGNFGELGRIMEEGRWLGINTHLGIHQLSQVRETYGENGSETIIGLCSYLAFLKSNDLRTQKWMSEVVGNCLRSYEKASFSYSTSQGLTSTSSNTTTEGRSTGTSESNNRSSTAGTSKTTGDSSSTSYSQQRATTSQSGQPASSTSGTSDTVNISANSSQTRTVSASVGVTLGTSQQASSSVAIGKSEAYNNSTTEGHSITRELRGEPAIEPHEFRNFPDPTTAGVSEGVYLTPTLPVYRTRLTLAQMKPEFESVAKLNRTNIRRAPEDDDRASKSEEWTLEDLERLCIDVPSEHLYLADGASLFAPLQDAEPQDDALLNAFNSEEPTDEENEDELPPADFDF